MTRRETIRTIIARKPADRCGFWLGNPHPDTWPLLHQHFGTTGEEELRTKVGDDCRWICPQFYPDVYRDSQGRELFDAGLDRAKHAAPPLAACETVGEVERYAWPNPDFLNFETCLRDLAGAGDVYRMSGFWTCFYHNMADLFGLEEYFVKMYNHRAASERGGTGRLCSRS